MTSQVLLGDCRDVLKTLPAESAQCCVTSPPYFGLRDYGCAGQIGLEQTPDAYVAELVAVFREVRRVLRDDGTLWLNLGDSYAGYWGDKKAKAEGRPSAADGNGFSMNARPKFHDAFDGSAIKPKDLIGIPWRVAFALQADGWYLRQDIVWSKPNPMPESVTDRCTKAHEYIFLLTKSAKYYFDAAAIAEQSIHAGETVFNDAGKNSEMGAFGATRGGFLKDGGVTVKDTRNKRSVWTVSTKPYSGAHFATFPPDLIEPCILAGSKTGDMVLDPFNGSGTTGEVASRFGRNYTGIELNPAYVALTEERWRGTTMGLPLEAA